MVARPMPAPPTRKKMSKRAMGSLVWRVLVVGCADFEQRRGLLLACVEEEAGEGDAVGVGGGDGGRACGGTQRGEAEAEDDGVGRA